MKIKNIRLLPLRGATPDGGWTADEELADDNTNLHTLIELITCEGVTGLGSVFTSAKLVEGAVEVIRPLIIGASALDPAAVSENLHQQTFWQGRGGAITHAISGIDIALWDIFGKVTGQPISRLLGGRFRESIKTYGSVLMDEPDRLRAKLEEGMSRGFRAFKMGWGPFGRKDAKTDERIVEAARETIGPDRELMVDSELLSQSSNLCHVRLNVIYGPLFDPRQEALSPRQALTSGNWKRSIFGQLDISFEVIGTQGFFKPGHVVVC